MNFNNLPTATLFPLFLAVADGDELLEPDDEATSTPDGDDSLALIRESFRA